MPKRLRRVEILLPLQFNDGSVVPPLALGRTLRDIRVKFGAVTTETQLIRGSWTHKGQVYSDDLNRLFVDVEEDATTLPWFVDFKQTLLERYRQIDIWMTTYLVEAI
ncbi:MAG: hypothetical protein AAF743_14875 [Planctomycetota bacterium]